VTYTDPYIPEFKHAHLDLKSIEPEAAMKACDCAVIITDHKVFDYARIVDGSPLIVDTRNALKGVTSDKIFRL